MVFIFFNELIVGLYAECPKCGEGENTQHIPATKYLVLFQSLCKPRLLTPTLLAALPRRLTQTQLDLRTGRMRRTGQGWAGLVAERQFGCWRNDLGQVAFSASGSTSTPPKGHQPLRSLPLTKNGGLWLCAQHVPSMQKRCPSCKIFPGLNRPHTYWTKIIWKICREPVRISPCQALLPLAPSTARTRLAFRSRFPPCTEMSSHPLRVTRARQGSATLGRSSVILCRNKMMTGKERKFTT